MGKAKKGKKHSHQPKALGKLLLSSDHSTTNTTRQEQQKESYTQKIHTKYQLSELQTNLNSLLPEKRLHACHILADIYEFNQNQDETLDILTNTTILTSLLTRLIDNSTTVQVQASRAIKNLTESKSLAIIEKILTSGIYRTMIGLILNRIDPTHFLVVGSQGQQGSNDSSIPSSSSSSFPLAIEFELTIFQNLLYSIANILSRYPLAIQEIVSFAQQEATTNSSAANNHQNLIHFLFHLLQIPTLHVRVINTILNVFIILSKMASIQVVSTIFLQSFATTQGHSITGTQLFEQYLTHLLQKQILSSNNTSFINLESIINLLASGGVNTTSSFDEEHYDGWILILQTIEILFNLSIFAKQSDLATVYYVKIIFFLFQSLSNQRDNVSVSIQDIAKDIAEEDQAKLNYDSTNPKIAMNVESNGEMMDETDHSTSEIALKGNREEEDSTISSKSKKSAIRSENNTSSLKKQYLSQIIHNKIDLIEIIAELFTSIIQRIKKQYRLSASVNEENDGLRESEEGDVTPTALQANDSATLFLQSLEELSFSSFLLTNTIIYLKQILTYCAIPSVNDTWLIIAEGVKILSVLEKVTIAFYQTYSVKTYLLSLSAISGISVNLVLNAEAYLDHLQFLYNSTNNITAKLDPATNSVIESWKAREEEDLLTLKTIVLQQSITYLEVLKYFLRLHETGSTMILTLVKEEPSMKTILVPFLLYWMNLPQFELLFVIYDILQQITTIYIQSLANTPLRANQETFPIPKSIYIFLMNSLLNRIEHASCYLYDISKPIEKSASSSPTAAVNRRNKRTNLKNKKNGSSSSASLSPQKKRLTKQSLTNPSKSIHNLWQESKQYNLQKNSLLWMDLLINLMIDLNSSDHCQLHDWYSSLHTNERLISILRDYQQKYQQFLQFHQQNYSFIPIKSNRGDDDDEEEEDDEEEDEGGEIEDREVIEEKERLLPSIIRLTKQEKEKIEETSLNLENFIVYKQTTIFK